MCSNQYASYPLAQWLRILHERGITVETQDDYLISWKKDVKKDSINKTKDLMTQAHFIFV